jgi:CBS domain-containing protein
MKSIQDVMTPNPIALDSSATVAEAAQKMKSSDVGTVVVVEEDQLLGILTDRDIVVRCIAEGKNPDSTDCGDVCSRNVATLSPGDSVEFALDLMTRHSVRRLPVVQQGKAIGIVSLGDTTLATSPDSPLGEISSRPPNR